jgi:hypothetical protein
MAVPGLIVRLRIPQKPPRARFDEFVQAVAFREVLAGTNEAGQGVDALKGEADKAGIVLDIERLRVGIWGPTGEDHALQAAEGDAENENFVIKDVFKDVLVKFFEVVGRQGGGVEAVGEGVPIAQRRPQQACGVGSTEGRFGAADGPGFAVAEGAGSLVGISWHSYLQ